MKKWIVSLLLLAVWGGTSCVTSKSLENEKRLEEWLTNAARPVSVQFQAHEMRCKPGLHCYTLIDSVGKIHYAKNVRYRLPPIIQ